ncbi:MAG: hypothetical protein JSS11_06395 [Verrucomicrobia bacterium]|nr:hypothetical protein [Verrucomicrobiota bacterium]
MSPSLPHIYLAGIKQRLRGGGIPMRRFAAWHKLCAAWLFRMGFNDDALPDGVEIDVVIPTVPKDLDLLNEVLAGVRRHVGHPIGTIYIVAPHSAATVEFCRAQGCVFADERSLLGYGKEAVPYVALGQDRSGWLFQQLLKLAAAGLVQRSHYLVLDSDTILVRRHVFTHGGRYFVLTSGEWHPPYLSAFRALFGYPAPRSISYTAHMMLFNRDYLRQMKAELEGRHGVPWDQAYRSCASPDEPSCTSDYDNYAYWMWHRHPDVMQERPFYNTSLSRGLLRPLAELHECYGKDWKSLSFHSYRN